MATEDKEPTSAAAPDVATPRTLGEPAPAEAPAGDAAPHRDEANAPAPGAPAGDAADRGADTPATAEDRFSPAFLNPDEARGDDRTPADTARERANKAAVASREAEDKQLAKFDREAQEARDADPADFATQEEYRRATTSRAPLRDEAAHAAAVANESAVLAGHGRHLDQAPVRDEDTVHIDPALDDRIPVNELAMRLGQTPNGTTTCWACGHQKPQPARPGRDLPEEMCPFCGRGSQAEPL